MSVVYFTDRDLGLRFPDTARIRYKPNELAAVVRHQARVLVIVGKAPLPVLAQSFVLTAHRIEEFLAAQAAPFVGKVYRASPNELAKDPAAPGRIELWYPGARRS